MQTIRLGANGPTVSRISLGTWTFAGGALWSPIDEGQCVSVIHSALDCGISLFDSAPNYGDGRSERILGSALKKYPDAMVATKFKVDKKSPLELIGMVESSLKRLEREAIDLMQIHWPTETIEESAIAFDTLKGLQAVGKIRYLGVCNFGVQDLQNFGDQPIISNQLPYNLMWRVIEKGIAQKSKELGLGVIAYSPLQQGLLGGKYHSLSQFPESRKQTRHFSSHWPATRHNGPGMEAETERCLQGFIAIADEIGHSPLHVAIAYVLQRPFIDVVLAGARSIDQLKELVSVFDCFLDNGTIAKLDSISEDLLRATEGNPDMYQIPGRVH
jgi:myo-inositol catabolism protein IolS